MRAQQLGFLVYFLSSLLCVFVHASLVVDGGKPSDPSLTQIPRDLYHSSDDLLREVRGLVGRHPDKLAMEIMQAANKGYSAEILVVTYSHFTGHSENNTEFRILLSFGQHGRELITSEVALRLLSILSGEHPMFSLDGVPLDNVLGNLIIKVVPMENLNGRRLVEEGDICDRRNGRGVDLNRNWSVDWGKKEKDFDPYEEFPGTAPFSEPEVQIMRELSKSFSPHVWANIHSGMEALFMPYDHKNTTPDGHGTDLMKFVLNELNHHHCHDQCVVGSGGGSVGYLAHGTSTDYMYDVVKVPLAFTFEIYGDPESSPKDCFKMFNPVDHASFNRVLDDWCAAFIRIFEIAPQQFEKAHLKYDSALEDYEALKLRRENGKRVEGLELGLRELRTYFRLFMLSSVLLMFMFCSRISKSKLIPALLPASNISL